MSPQDPQHIAIAVLAVCGFGSLGCGGAGYPKTDAELVSGSSYIPLNPKPVRFTGQKPTSAETLGALPNETVRMSIASRDQTGALTFVVGAVGVEGHSYEVIIDYVKYTVTYLPISTRAAGADQASTSQLSHKRTVAVTTALGEVSTDYSSVTMFSTTLSGVGIKFDAGENTGQSSCIDGRIPVYIGVGLRLRASVQVLKGSVQLSSLFGLGVAANTGSLSGSLTMQTLGIHGPAVSALMPLPNEVSQSSIQGAMQSFAAIKAKLYDTGANGVTVIPQIVAFDSPVPGGPISNLM